MMLYQMSLYRCDQAHVPSAEGECVRSGSKRHVLPLTGFRGRRQSQVEVCER